MEEALGARPPLGLLRPSLHASAWRCSTPTRRRLQPRWRTNRHACIVETCVALGRLCASCSTLTAGMPSRSMVTLDGSAASVTRSCWNASTSSASTILRPLSSRRISPFAFFGYGAARAPKNVLELGECLGGLTGSGRLGPPASRPMPSPPFEREPLLLAGRPSRVFAAALRRRT